MATQQPKRVRCVIYTRKSVEQGLEQEFNSLDAQRAACEAYIASRRMDGWELIPDHYDDGGFSGGNMKRPAFQRLLEDVRAGKIDMIVCYKIDRLSRRLLDFADVFKFLEDHNVAFCCVTQEFNTSTSMGRMVMNLLMTFAQFEREQSAERVRDKMVSTCQKGMWPGGPVPYGYKAVERRLVPDPETAPKLRRIFELYVETGGSRLKIIRKLTEAGIYRFPAKGVPFNTNMLDRCLKNATYIGKVVYGDKVYDGVHEPILDLELWNKVQGMIKRIDRSVKVPGRPRAFSLLDGLISCGTCGSSMSYAWTSKKKNGTKYGYYVDVGDAKRGTSTCQVRRIAAALVEPAVEREVFKLLKTPTMLSLVAEELGCSYFEALAALDNEIAFWQSCTPEQERGLFSALLEKVIVKPQALDLRVRTAGYQKFIGEIKDGNLNG